MGLRRYSQRGPQIGFFWTRDFPYLKLGIRDFPCIKLGIRDLKAKSGRVWGFESILGRWDAKNIPRDYGIARNFWSGLKGLKYPIGDRTCGALRSLGRRKRENYRN